MNQNSTEILIKTALNYDLRIYSFNQVWKFFQPNSNNLITTCVLRNLCGSQEATVRTLYGTTDWFRIEKGVWQCCLWSPCLFNLYAEYIMRNAGLDELQAGINISGRNINNLRYADDITLVAESQEKLKNSWWGEELRWQRYRTGRTLSPPQIHQKNI